MKGETKKGEWDEEERMTGRWKRGLKSPLLVGKQMNDNNSGKHPIAPL